MRFPELDEFQRAHNLKPEFVRGLQRKVREAIIPFLAQADEAIRENAELKATIERLQSKARKGAA